jgi:hypothetical protein
MDYSSNALKDSNLKRAGETEKCPFWRGNKP